MKERIKNLQREIKTMRIGRKIKQIIQESDLRIKSS
jgi:hypothetical protein